MQIDWRHVQWPENRVRVWVWQLASHEPRSTQACILSLEERARAARFVFDQHRNLFVSAHVGLRRLLGRLLGTPPEQIVLASNVFGKPRLVNFCSPPLFFNLSHSDDHAAVAVSQSFEVGIDIERVRPISVEIARHFFSSAEVAALNDLPARLLNECVFNVWTRKEAYLKALGLGLSIPLNSFDMSATYPARLLHIAGSPDEPAQWQLTHFVPSEGFVGAVAARARNWHLDVFRI